MKNTIVKNSDGTQFTFQGNSFSVENGTLFVGSKYDLLAIFAPGCWDHVSVKETKIPSLLDLDKLDSLLRLGEPVFLTYTEQSEVFQDKARIDVYKHNSDVTEIWRGHQIHCADPLYEEEIVARSRAYVAKVTKESKQT